MLKVYLETTIPSYLTARPSRDLIDAARQEITREWWAERREAFDIFISQLVVDEATPDAYGWQEGMLRFLAERRERAAAESAMTRPTRLAFRRIVEAVDQLEDLRLSESQPLSGPPPTDPLTRRVWSSVRDPRFEPVELELGSLLEELHRGHVPQLENERWFSSFLSCMIVCQRHFEEQARLGAERASQAEFVRSQWDRVLAAAQALDAWATYVDRPGGVESATSSPSRHPSRR